MKFMGDYNAFHGNGCANGKILKIKKRHQMDNATKAAMEHEAISIGKSPHFQTLFTSLFFRQRKSAAALI